MANFIQSPDTFYVEEIPEIEPAGKGEHLYVTFQRKGMSTFYIASQLKKILKINENEIGIAGNKDKLSTAVQTFSLPLRLEPKILKAFNILGVNILSQQIHKEKLRIGRIAGNRFRIVLETESREDYEKLVLNMKKVEEDGFPNYYGPQRVYDAVSIEQGRKIFLNKSVKKGKRKDRFLVSVFQSSIFNSYLRKRIESKIYPTPIPGDVVRIEEKVFVLNKELEGKDCSTKGVIFTGPIIGSKMVLPIGESLSFEKAVIEDCGISFDQIFLSRAKGSRRDCIAKVGEISIREISDSRAELCFRLKSGSYATTLLEHLGIHITYYDAKQ